MPQPPNTGGYMGYAPGVDTGIVMPWAMQADDRFNASATSTTFLAANNTYISTVTWNAFGNLYAFRYRCGTGGNGHVDIGLLDQFGNLLTHTGITSTSGSASGTTINLANTYGLRPTKFYLAFWTDGANGNLDTFRQVSVANGVSMSSFASTGAGGLPATITPPLGSLGIAVCVDGLISGGWS